MQVGQLGSYAENRAHFAAWCDPTNPIPITLITIMRLSLIIKCQDSYSPITLIKPPCRAILSAPLVLGTYG